MNNMNKFFKEVFEMFQWMIGTMAFIFLVVSLVLGAGLFVFWTSPVVISLTTYWLLLRLIIFLGVVCGFLLWADEK